MGFFANMAWGPILAVPAEIFTPEVYGKAMGLVNCCGYVAAALATKVFSALVIETEGAKNYTPGWIFIAACAIVGMVAAGFIRTPAQTQLDGKAENHQSPASADLAIPER